VSIVLYGLLMIFGVIVIAMTNRDENSTE